MVVVSQNSTIRDGGKDEAEMSQNTVPLSRYFLGQDALLTCEFRDMRPAQKVAALALLCHNETKLNIYWQNGDVSENVVIANVNMPGGILNITGCRVLIQNASTGCEFTVDTIANIEVVSE